MKPFKLRVDWTCQKHYGGPVDVDLLIMDAAPKTLRREPTLAAAVDFALRWLRGRGFDFWCDIDLHQRLDHTYITLHPRPAGEVRATTPAGVL